MHGAALTATKPQLQLHELAEASLTAMILTEKVQTVKKYMI